MRLRNVAFGLAALAILPALGPAAFAPADPGVIRLSRASLPSSSESALAIVEPSVGFTDAESAALYQWVFDGGHLLLVDDSAVGIDLTARMGAPVALVSVRLFSPIFDGTPERIPLLDLGTIPGLPGGLTTSRPLLVLGGHDAVLVPTLTWADRNDNARPDLGEVLARGSIMSVVDIGSGVFVILSDPRLYERPEVRDALDHFITEGGNRDLVFDGSHGPRVDPYSTNVLLTSAPPRVFAITLLTAVALVAFLVIARPAVTRIAPRRPPRADDEIVRQALSELE